MEKETIIELNNLGLSKKEISLRMNKTVFEIRRIFSKLKIKAHKKPSFWTKELVEKLTSLRKEGHTGKEIAATLGLTEDKVFHKLYSIKSNKENAGRDNKDWTREEESLVVLRLSEGKTIGEIAEECQRTPIAILWKCGKLKVRKLYPQINIGINEYRNRKVKPDGYLRTKIHSAKRNSIDKGLAFDLDFDFIKELLAKQQGKCFFSGIELQFKPHDIYSMSIDRVDSLKSYTRDNVVLTCWVVNMMKRDLTNEVFIELCKKITDNQSNAASSEPLSCN